MIPVVRRLPIRRKVAMLIGAALAAGLVLSVAVVVLYEITTFRPRLVADARTQADLIRVNSVAALQFNDREAAAENLATARRRPEILAATLFRPDGTTLARYTVPGGPPAPTSLVAGIRFLPGRLLLVDSVVVDSQPVGWLSLQYAVPSLWQRLPGYGIMAAVVLLALASAGALLLGMLGRSVSAPLVALTGAASEITRTGSFRLRVPDRSAGDEIGELTRAFNRMVATLEQSEARLRLALEAARMETWVVDLAGGADHALEELLHRVHPDDRPTVEQAVRRSIADGLAFDVEFRAAGPEGEGRWTALRGQPFAGAPGAEARSLIGVAQDVTDRRRMERQLIESQRMEAIGNLAGGIAHDFNNLLTGMLGYLAFVRRRLPGDPRLLEDFGQVERSAQRAATLTSQLLSYARRQMVVPAVLDLNATVTGLEPMIRRIVGEDIEVTTALAPDLGRTRVDPGHLDQVLLNLVANARDAMPHGGRLAIRTWNTRLPPSAEAVGRRTGEYVALEVSDTGSGMTPEVLARVFEPFFTTKPVGAGTGLGLSMCYGIVKQAEGHIEVASEPGRGSRFTVLLPRHVAAPEPSEGQGAARPAGGPETILLVEDDDTVRELGARVLRDAGYTVLTAAGSAEAVEAIERHGGTVDLLVTDVVMPGGGGRELAAALARRRPTLAVLYMSGYTEDVVLRQGLVRDAVAFLGKPFTDAALVQAVRRTLDARATSATPTDTSSPAPPQANPTAR